MAGLSLIRKWVTKQLTKPNAEGIMKIPDKGNIDFGEMLVKEKLFTSGIDEKLIQSEKQLERTLDSIEAQRKQTLKRDYDEHVGTTRTGGKNYLYTRKEKPKKSGEVIKVDFDKGRWNKAGGGSAKESWTDKLVRWGGGPSVLAGELGLEGINQIYQLLNMPGLYSKGGRTGFQDGAVAFPEEEETQSSFAPGKVLSGLGKLVQLGILGPTGMITDPKKVITNVGKNILGKKVIKPVILKTLEKAHGGGGGGTSIGGGQQTSKGIAGGAVSHSAAKEARGGMSGWGLAEGGPAGLSYLLAEDTNERIPYVFGGRTIGVLKNLLTKFKKSSGIPRGEKTLKPDVVAKRLMSEEDKLKLLQFETNYANSILEHLKADRQLFKQLQTNKEMKDEGLDFLMKHFVDTQAPHMKNYKSIADIDQAILELETLVKNKTLKEGRKLNAEGGRIGFSSGGVGKPPVTFYFDMQGGAGKKETNFLGVEGLTKKGYDYGGTLAADTTFPLFGGELSVGGELGFGRDKSNVDYKGQPIDWLSNVGETKLGDNWNVGMKWRKKFAGGGMSRRAFLKIMAALGLTGAAAKSGLSSLFKAGKPVAKELTQVPIKNIDGMPAWFKPLVNKIIKEGEEAKVTEYDRLVTHTTKLPDSKTPISVSQDLNNGDVWVDIGEQTKHGWADGKYGQPVRLEYKAEEVLEPGIGKSGKIEYEGGKSKEEFWVEEAEFTGGHPENVKFEESTIEKFGNHESNFDEIEAFATGKTKKGARNVSESFDKMNEDIADHFSNYPTPDDFASGGLAKMLGE